jgi:PadR family transcriptional regulator, phenolic acid-responsive transcriptional regulator
MSLDHVLLGLLREPASGYDLKKLVDERICHFWAAELSQIYPTLKRLEKRGLVRSRSAVAKRGRGRRVYGLTPAGRDELRAWLGGPPHFAAERMAYLAQLYFMGELEDLHQTQRFFRAVRERFAAKLATLASIERMWAAADPRYPQRLPDEDLHVHLALRKGMHSLQAHLEWCDESLTTLNERLEPTGPGQETAAAVHQEGL